MRSPAYTIALICALLATLVPVLAIQANLAGIVDWHKPLIGEPVLEPTPPSFVELSTGKRVIAVTKSNVLACLDAKTGDIAWRYKLEDQDPVVSFHLNGESVLLLSGSSGTTARLFSVVTGAVIWERPLHADSAAVRLTTPVHLGTDVGFTKPVLPGVPTSEDGSVVILSDGRRLTKLALSDGQVQWGLDAPGAGSTVLFKQLLVTGDSLHIMALTSGFSETTLTTLSFDVNTARPLGDFTQIPSSIANPSDAHLAATSVEGPARVLWLEHGRIRSAYLSAAGLLGNVKDLLPGKGAKFASILDVRTRQRGFILGKKGNGAVQIIDVRNGAKIVDEFESSHDSNDKSPSVYTARVSETGITFNRVYWSFSLGLAATQTYSISDTDGLVATGFTFPFDTSSHGVILANAVSTPWGSTEWPTILLTTSSGAIQSVTAETPMWTREESLANIVAVKFIDLGERQVEETRQILADENIAQRLTRQLVELKDLPAYIFRFIYRLSSASYKSTLITAPLNATNLHRDQFGFQKLLVAVTKSGKVFALDSSNGHTIWSRNLGITDYTGAELHVEDMWTVREFGDSVNPTLAILATRTRDGVTQTVGFHVDGFTGKISGEVDAHTGLPLGKVIFEGRHEAAFLTAHENCGTGNRVLAVADSSRQVYIFPFCKTLFEKIAKEPGLFFTTVAPSTDGSTLEGHVTSAPSGKSFVSLPTWSIGMTPGETLHSVTPISSGPISSYGRVAGDKSTLYKYLNPHLQVVVTLQHEQHRANVFVVDSVTGKKVYESHIDSVITAKGVKVVMSENWLVFTWLEKEGGRIGSVELYEDRSRDHTPSPDSSAFASNRHVVSEAKYFILPVEVKALGMTVSKFGITAKELVYINDRNQVASIPRRLLDPRRPRGAPTSSDKEEMLVPYDPLIGPEIKRVVSHKYQVLGATTLTSSPALVESTSLLFAHGLDLFLTRGVNPSGTFDMLTDSFNKAQLLLTLAVLSVGLAVAKPAVDRAALKAKWF